MVKGSIELNFCSNVVLVNPVFKLLQPEWSIPNCNQAWFVDAPQKPSCYGNIEGHVWKLKVIWGYVIMNRCILYREIKTLIVWELPCNASILFSLFDVRSVDHCRRGRWWCLWWTTRSTSWFSTWDKSSESTAMWVSVCVLINNNNNNWFLYSAFLVWDTTQSALQWIITPVTGYNINPALIVHLLNSLGSILARHHFRGAHTHIKRQHWFSHPTGYPFIHLGREQQCGLKVPWNANACWFVLIYNTLTITNVAKRLFKYVPYILL